MSAKRIRRSLEAMVRRWKADARRLDQLGIGIAYADFGDPATEVDRNLCTAIEHAEMFLGMADEAISERARCGDRP